MMHYTTRRDVTGTVIKESVPACLTRHACEKYESLSWASHELKMTKVHIYYTTYSPSVKAAAIRSVRAQFAAGHPPGFGIAAPPKKETANWPRR